MSANMGSDWLESIYTDGSYEFVNPCLPKKGEEVKIVIRMFENAPVNDVMLRTRINGGETRIHMKIEYCKKGFAYYTAKVKCNEDRLRYQFYIVTDEKIYYYNQAGVTEYMTDEVHDFCIVYDYRQPEWVKGAVFYQIFPERFCNGNKEISVKDGEYSFDGYETIQIKDWNSVPKSYDEAHCLDFYGGDLYGIKEKIPYFKELGITALYVNPIFYAATVHKYDCLDYFTVDPHFGGDEALIELVDELHKNGIKIILDVSINHTGSAHKWFNKDCEFFDKSVGAYNNPDSLERNYYFFSDNNEYKCWWDVSTLPTLNYSSRELRKILYLDENSLVKKWLKPPFNIDGWRFDVADVMARSDEGQFHHEVWPELAKSIKDTKNDAYIVAEEWGDCEEFLRGNEWDTPMNYFGCARPVREFAGEGDLFLAREESVRNSHPNTSAHALAERICSHFQKIPYQLQQVQFNLIGSHDTSRLHNNPKIPFDAVKAADVILFTLPGSSSIYYGDEAYIDGRINDTEGCRYPMPWNKDYKNDEPYICYQKLAYLKQSAKAFTDGGFKILWDRGRTIAYARFREDELYYVICSLDDIDSDIELPFDIFGVDDIKKLSDVFGQDVKFNVRNGHVIIKVKSKSSYVLRVN